MQFKVTYAIAAFTMAMFTAVSAAEVQGNAVNARAELYDTVMDIIERSQNEELDVRAEKLAFADVFNRAACPAGFYFDTVRNRCCSLRTRCR